MRTRSWEAPASIRSDRCDCFWHRRIFSFVARGPVDRDSIREGDALPLARLVTRYDYANGDLLWEAEMQLESCLLVARRSIAMAGNGDRIGPVFSAYAEVGGARAVELTRDNPQAKPTRGLGNGDPTLVFMLPANAGRLVIWPEAWWWRLMSDGHGVLHDPIDPVWSDEGEGTG